MGDCEILNADAGCDLVVNHTIGDGRADAEHQDLDELAEMFHEAAGFCTFS
jgi:uncharacterized protein (UPF0264 family)